jgi:NAD/NADP transhydrogenase beta subunit
MSINLKEFKILLAALAIWCALLTAGRLISHWEWSARWGTTWFNAGWVETAVLTFWLMAICSMWRRSRRIGYRHWLFLVIPLVVCEALRWKMAIAVKAFAGSTNGQSLSSYATYSGAYTAALLIWIVGFPSEESWGYPSDKGKLRTWNLVLLSIAATIGWVTYRRSFAIIGRFQGAVDASSMLLLQQWMQSVTVVVFVFLLVRTLLSLTFLQATKVFGAGQST